MPLPGVAVIQRGTTLGAATDVDGRFEFKLTEKNVTLVFSFVGMKTKELLYDGSDKLLDVTMEEEKRLRCWEKWWLPVTRRFLVNVQRVP